MTVRIQRPLLLLLLLLTVQHCHGQQVHVRQQQIAAAPSSFSQIPRRRQLQIRQDNNTISNFTEACSLCSGFPIRQDTIPPQYPLEGVPPNLTCGELEVIFSTLPIDYSEFSSCLGGQALFSSVCCQRPYSQNTCEQNVRTTLLQNYDSSILPLAEDGMLQVELLVNLLHISELSTKQGMANVFVWFHLTWKDPRLAWTITDENCTTSITARASIDFERTEIYVPDVDCLNQVSGGTQSFPEAMATIYNDGTVIWKRNGGLKAFCFFTGLNRFPFDTLGCSFLIGAWVRPENVAIALGGANQQGWMAGGSLDKVIYNEYTLVVDRTQSGYYALPSKHIVYFNLYFERSSRYYVLKVLLPTMVFTILAFGVFFLDLRVGERLTYGLTVLLVIIAQDISTSTLLPITDKRLWINMFVVGSFYWVLITNLESVFVAWLYFVGDEDHYDDRHKRGGSVKDKERENGRTNDNAGAAPNEVDSIATGVPPKPAVYRDDEEQAGAYEDNASSDKPASSEHGTRVSFKDTKDDELSPEKDASSQSDRRSKFTRAAQSSRRFLTFRQLLVQENQPAKKRHRTIRRIDKWAFWILFTSYILYVILMFATNSLWDDRNYLYVEEDEPNTGP